jgi:hypothetical protein
LSDAVQAIQQGGSAQTGWSGAVGKAIGSPIGRAALGGLNAIDIPRRGVISALKEVNDYLDQDPNTNASFKDFKSQVSDPTFGFGRVMPSEGWKGRIIGLIGDIALDPITYMGLGGVVASGAKAVARGAGTAGLRATARVGAQDVALRAALGTKYVGGREGRFALANLVKQYGGTSAEVAKVASHGKSAVPEDIAKVIGLQRNGLYMFGSRVRIPFSGPIGSALEYGLVKTRLGITNTAVGKKLQYLYTPRGASARLGDQSRIRADMASGRIAPETVDLIMTQLSGVENARRLGASVAADTANAARVVAQLSDVQSFRGDVAKFIEDGSEEFLSTSQSQAKRAVQDFFKNAADTIEGLMRRVDPEWTMPRLPNYVPHVLSDKARLWMEANLDNAWVKRLESYLTSDVLDLKNNMAGRYLVPGVKFLDSERHVIQTGSIGEINGMFRDLTGKNFDLFETDINRIMGKYVDTVRSAAEISALLSDLKSSDFVRLLRTQGEVDPEYLLALRSMVQSQFDEAAKLNQKLRGTVVSIVDEIDRQFSRDVRSSAASKLAASVSDIRGDIASANRQIAAGEKAQVQLDDLLKQIDDLIAKEQTTMAQISSSFEDQSIVYDLMKISYDKTVVAARDLSQQVLEMRRRLADAGANAADLNAFHDELKAKALVAARTFEDAEKLTNFYREYGDSVAPALQDIYSRIRDAAFDGDLPQAIYVGDELWKGERSEQVNAVLEILMKPFDVNLYPSSTSLGDDWTKLTFEASDDAGRMIRSITDLGSRRTKAQRASMARPGSRRQISMDDARSIIARSSWVGDNPEDVGDAFTFLSLRELRAAYDSVGGGEAGIAAQNAVAKELLAGETTRSKLWLEARDAAERVMRSKQQLDVIGSRREQLGGRYTNTAMETIERLESQLEAASRITNAEVANSLTKLSSTFEVLGKDFSATNRDTFLQNASSFLNTLRSQNDGLAFDEKWLQLELAGQGFAAKIANKEEVLIDDINLYFNQLEALAQTEFQDTARVRELSRLLRSQKKYSSEAMKIDKQFNDGVTTLTDSVVDSGMKLSNYMLWHATRIAGDAIRKLGPSGMEIGETMWGYALAGAARQQLQTTLDFQNTRILAERAMRTVRDKVYGAKPADRARILRDAMNDLSPDEYQAVSSTIGNIAFAEQGKLASLRMPHWRRNTPEYVAVRDEILSKKFPGWDDSTDRIVGGRAVGKGASRAGTPYTFEGEVRGRRAIVSDVERAVVEAEERGVSIAETARGFEAPKFTETEGTLPDIDLVRGKDYSGVGVSTERARDWTYAGRAGVDVRRSYLDATPKMLNNYVTELLNAKLIDKETADSFRVRIKSGEEFAKSNRKQALRNVDEEVLARDKRQLAREAEGARRSENEAFGLAGAYSKAIATRPDGGTQSSTRIDEFFTYVFGDGKVRLATGDSSSRAPVRKGLSPAEQEQARQVKFLFAKERQQKELRRRQGVGDLENELQFWRNIAENRSYSKTGINQVVDYARAERIVLEKQSVRTTISDLEKIAKGLEAEQSAGKISLAQTTEGAYTVDGIKVRIGALRQRLKSLDRELKDMETTAGQLIPLGSGSENAYRTITVADSQFGKLDARLERRIEALRHLAIDPTAPQYLSDLSTGIGKRNAHVIGRFGWLEGVKSRINELDAAIEAAQKAEKNVRSKEAKISRAALKRQQNIAVAEAIRDNPTLDAYVGEVIGSKSPLSVPKGTKWLDASRLGQTYDEAGRPLQTIPQPVSDLINQAHRARLEMQRIERNPMYTRALQRKQEHDFFRLLSKLNLDGAALRFPGVAYTNETFGDLRRFASRGSGASLGLDPGSLQVRNATEQVYEQVAGKILADKGGKKFAVIVDGRRASRQAVVDSIKAREGRRFTYTGKFVKEGQQTKVYVTDKSTGDVLLFDDVALIPESAGKRVDETFDIELTEPIYLRDRNSKDGADFVDLLNPGKRNTVYQLGDILNAAQNKIYDPSNAIVSFSDANGAQRIFKMSEVGVEQRVSRALDPEVVFDARAGRGLTKDNFDALFEEPLQPGSAKARKMRADIDEQVTRRDALYRQQREAMQKMRDAQTEKARRTYQGLAASLGEDIQVMDEIIAQMDNRYRNSLPARHMETVQMATKVLDYFKEPTVHVQLGLKVDRIPVGVDPVSGQIQYQFAEITDSQAMGALKKYIEALEEGKLQRYAEEGVDVEEPLVAPSRRNRRMTYLDKQWSESSEAEILRRYNGFKSQDAAAAKALDEMRAGGPDAVLLQEKDAAIRERDRLLSELGIAENNVRKSLRGSGRPTEVSAFEGVDDITGARLTKLQARQIANEQQRALSAALESDVLNAVPPAVRAAAQQELIAATNSARLRGWLVDGSFANLQSAKAVEKVLQRDLDALVKQESRLNAALGGMIKIRMGESVDRRVRNAIPPEYKELQLRLNGNTRYGVKGIKQEIAEKQAQLAEIAVKRRALEAEVIQIRSAVDTSFTANLSKSEAEARLALTRDTLADMKAMRARAKKPKAGKPVKKTGKKALKEEDWTPKRPADLDWSAEYDDFVSELDDLIQRVAAMEDGPSTGRLAALVTEYAEGKAALLRAMALAGEGEQQLPAMLAMAPQVYSRVLDEGWIKLSGSGSLDNFKNLQMRPEVKEILENMNRLRTPAVVSELNRFIGRYTKFFKAWALATPGYHVRNSFTNAFMMFAAGGRPKFLYEGMLEYNALHKALVSGTPFETYVNTLPLERQTLVRQAYDAMLGSGVGQTAEIGFDTAGVLTNNPWTRGNRRIGVWTESHSRFMLAYDGLQQGLDVNGATARVRKFLFDYEDISTLDVTMRSIIPFWMWSSRILPLTIQNIYMNPRPYQWYGSLRRNLEDREQTEGLPKYMREAGAFALPGTSLAATPDLGFNRTQADIAGFTDPVRLAANVNPALRVPVELLAGKSFFRNRDFAEAPVEVSGPVGRLASLLGTPIGKGQMQGGKQFVDEDLLYAITNAAPLLNTAERFLPSQEYYQQRGSTNPLLGFLGAPVRNVTPEMRSNEQRRQLAEIRKLLRSQPKPEGE